MDRVCANCYYLINKDNLGNNEIQDEWVSCDMVYVETRGVMYLEEFGCSYFMSEEDWKAREEEKLNETETGANDD